MWIKQDLKGNIALNVYIYLRRIKTKNPHDPCLYLKKLEKKQQLNPPKFKGNNKNTNVS